MKKIFDIMTFYDKIFIIAVIAISILILLYPIIFNRYKDNGEEYIVIRSGSEVVERIPIEETYDEKMEIEVNGPIGTSHIEAYEGKVRLYEAPPDDPLKTCEKTGWIDKPGPSIICIPNKVSINIEKLDGDLDGVSW
ncbi:MAG: NusG domain II-containing protein [Halanaerobiales bacterium]